MNSKYNKGRLEAEFGWAKAQQELENFKERLIDGLNERDVAIAEVAKLKKQLEDLG
jgi:hypothetical protein